jgi:hypothetical protein
MAGRGGGRQALRIFLVALGVALFACLVADMGAGTILAQVSRFGWWFAVICLLNAAWFLFQALAWRTIQREHLHGVRLARLFGLKLVSDALNTLLPTANLGGEAARLHLSRSFMTRKLALAGLLVDKTVEYGAGIPFMALGFLAAWAGGFFPRPLLLPALLCLVVSLAGVLIFAAFQLKGMHPVLAALARVAPPLQRAIAERERQIRRLGLQLVRLYRVPRGRTLAAWSWHFLARLTGVLETFLIMRVLGWPVGLGHALFITAMVAGINTVFFLMPGQWGIAEGSHLFILHSMGYPPLIGLSMGVIKRVRKLAFAAAGVPLYYAASRRGAPPRAGESRG